MLNANLEEKRIALHLADIRRAIIYSCIGLVAASLIGIYYADSLVWCLTQPAQAVFKANESFVLLTPYEYFFVQLKAALCFGAFASSPWIFYQIWCFVAPGLYQNEKRYMLSFISVASVFFIAGAAFAYYIMFPFMFEFFSSSLPPFIHSMYGIGAFVDFAVGMLFIFGLVFETPIFIFLLVFFDFLSVQNLKDFRRYFIVLAFIIGALLTPPDPLSQVMLAIPLIFLYEIGIWSASLLHFQRS